MKPKRGPWPGKLAWYIDVDDLDTYSRRISENGGKIIRDHVEVPGVGHLSWFEDPDGRVLDYPCAAASCGMFPHLREALCTTC